MIWPLHALHSSKGRDTHLNGVARREFGEQRGTEPDGSGQLRAGGCRGGGVGFVTVWVGQARTGEPRVQRGDGLAGLCGEFDSGGKTGR